MRRANEVTDKIIMQVEQFKATLAAPTGKLPYETIKNKFVTETGLAPIDSEIQMLRNVNNDDEFFHVTCHIDNALKAKIERGDCIELDKLLPKDRPMGNRGDDEHPNRLELVNMDGHQYIAPYHEKTIKINGIRRWDQAFRVYAAVYTAANLMRSGEVWQYIHAIHTAVSNYSWECVSHYDYMFRKLMETKPWRSWGKTYTQGWNLVLRSNGAVSNNTGNVQNWNQPNGPGSNGRNGKQEKNWRDDCCWKFNRNKCRKTPSDCDYNHHCTYCGGWNHGYFNCRKRQRKDGRDGGKLGAMSGHKTGPSGVHSPPKKYMIIVHISLISTNGSEGGICERRPMIIKLILYNFQKSSSDYNFIIHALISYVSNSHL